MKLKKNEKYIFKDGTNYWVSGLFINESEDAYIFIKTNEISSPIMISKDSTILEFKDENMYLLGTKSDLYEDRFNKWCEKVNLKIGDIVKVFRQSRDVLACTPSSLTLEDFYKYNLHNEYGVVSKINYATGLITIAFYYKNKSNTVMKDVELPYVCLEKIPYRTGKDARLYNSNKIIEKFQYETGYVIPELRDWYKPLIIKTPTGIIRTSHKEIYEELTGDGDGNMINIGKFKEIEKLDSYFKNNINKSFLNKDNKQLECNHTNPLYGSIDVRVKHENSIDTYKSSLVLTMNGRSDTIVSDDVDIFIGNNFIRIVDNNETDIRVFINKNDNTPVKVNDIVLVRNNIEEWILGVLENKKYISNTNNWEYILKGNPNKYNKCIHYKGNEDKLHG